MIALIRFLLAILTSPFKSKSRLEAENAALRQQLVVRQRKAKGRAAILNGDRLFFVQLTDGSRRSSGSSPSSSLRHYCAGIGPAFAVIGAGGHGDAADGRRFSQSYAC
jgi:hypothetical protein